VFENAPYLCAVVHEIATLGNTRKLKEIFLTVQGWIFRECSWFFDRTVG
jgi:hypothetical protein